MDTSVRVPMNYLDGDTIPVIIAVPSGFFGGHYPVLHNAVTNREGPEILKTRRNIFFQLVVFDLNTEFTMRISFAHLHEHCVMKGMEVIS